MSASSHGPAIIGYCETCGPMPKPRTPSRWRMIVMGLVAGDWLEDIAKLSDHAVACAKRKDGHHIRR